MGCVKFIGVDRAEQESADNFGVKIRGFLGHRKTTGATCLDFGHADSIGDQGRLHFPGIDLSQTFGKIPGKADVFTFTLLFPREYQPLFPAQNNAVLSGLTV